MIQLLDDPDEHDERARRAAIAGFDAHLRAAIASHGGPGLAVPGRVAVQLPRIAGQLPTPVIWDAILWAADRMAPYLHAEPSIVVNGRNLGQELPGSELGAAAQPAAGR